MVIVTLIGEHQAEEGNEFFYLGSLTECKDCRLKAVCFNLDRGNKYRITGLREVTHDCKMHEDGVRVIEVERVPIKCAVPSKYAIEGSTITIEGVNCENIGCENYRLCHPLVTLSKSKRRVKSVQADLECYEDRGVVLVELE